MSEYKISDLEWHDAIILSTTIHRNLINQEDELVINIKFPDKKQGIVIFTKLLYIKMNLNFGISTPQNILDINEIHASAEMELIKGKWSKFPKLINDLKGYEIITNTSNSNITVFCCVYTINIKNNF